MTKLILLLTLGLLPLCGCALNPSKSHVIHIGAVGTKIGIVQDPISGMYSLSAQRVQADLITIPIMFTTNKAGDVVVIIPDVVHSFEVNAHNAVFGNVSTTTTMATGTNAVHTTLGGQHQPINAGVGTGSNLPAQPVVAPAPQALSAPGTPAFEAIPAAALAK